MYQEFFSLKEQPFSISPDPDFLFLSDRHKEALAHLKYGLQGNGGFVLLTGEVGTGKTTVCRFLLQEMPEEVDVAFILNPALTEIELLATICDEFNIHYQLDKISLKSLFDALTSWMMDNLSQGRSAVVLIDEAQHLSFSVLEQLRLLTNIESNNKKPLQVILIGQTELQQKLKQTELRQLAQRITARYHLLPLTAEETEYYIQHRLNVAGTHYPLFDPRLPRKIFKHSQGIPRLINLICDRCLLCTYSENASKVSPKMLKLAVQELALDDQVKEQVTSLKQWGRLSFLALLILLTGMQLPKIAADPFFRMIFENVLAVTAPKAVMETEITAAKAVTREAGKAIVIAETVMRKEGELTAVAEPLTREEEEGIAIAETAKQGTISAAKTEKGRVEETVMADKQEAGLWFDDYPQLDLSAGAFAHALQSLYAVWGYRVELADVDCEQGAAVSLLCFSESSNIDKLRQLNYPAVLKLESENDSLYAVIYKISEHYQLIIGEQSIEVSEAWLQRYWSGGLTLLWQAPFALDKALKFGQESKQVAWLNQQLNKVYAQPIDNKARFDLPLVQRVKQFQREHFLTDDGIAGERTLMVLMQKINPQLPRLGEENL